MIKQEINKMEDFSPAFPELQGRDLLGWSVIIYDV